MVLQKQKQEMSQKGQPMYREAGCPTYHSQIDITSSTAQQRAKARLSHDA